MNSKTVAIVLTLVCVLLGAALIYRHSTAVGEKKKDVDSIGHFSNQWVVADKKARELNLVNLSLERDLATQAEELKTYSNNLASLTSDFTKVQAEAKTAAEKAKQEMHRRDTRITELENERDGMTRKMNDLTGSINNLENQIADTQRKLEASEGDREFLLKELKRLQAEKSELERQFNNLAMLRDQVRKLRDELSVSRRLEWIRRGLYGSLKGGELLRRGFASAADVRTNYNLDVEIRREGGATVLTNTPSTEASTVSTNASAVPK